MAFDKILTVIVPSYNMEKYLPKCLGSLIVAPELMERIEVIVVNDGSTDRTSEIAHEFAANYPQTFKVIDKSNGHYGSCINTALPIAVGTYIKILDADDTFDTLAFMDYMTFLIMTIESKWMCKPDMIWNDFVWEDERGVGFKTMRRNLPPRQLFDIEDPTVDLHGIYMHQVAYKTENLRAIGYRQDEGICYTDNEWCHIPVATVKTVVYCDIPLYRYFFGREGQSMDVSVMRKNLWMMEKVALRMAEDAKLAHSSAKIRQYLFDFASTVVGNIYRMMIVIIHDKEHDNRLMIFDETLLRFHREMFVYVAKVTSRFSRFNYIAAWRKTHSSNSILLKLYRVYLKMRRVK